MYRQNNQLVFIALGTNQGDKSENLDTAIDKIIEQTGPVLAMSKLYETDAWGLEDQEHFYNLVIAVDTDLTPQALLQKLLDIEKEMGRERIQKWGPRIIDLDILFYKNQIIDTPNLTIPHPDLQNRNFVLIPLLDICPFMNHPVKNVDVMQLYVDCSDTQEVRLVEEEEVI